MAEPEPSRAAGLGVRRSGSGRPLVLLHGWAMSSAVFTELLAAPPAGRELIALDLPGHGSSCSGEDNDLSAWTGRIVQALGELGVSSCDLLGWSLGGMLALQLAACERPVVDRLVLVSTSPRFTASEDWPCGLPMLQLRAMQRDLRQNFRLTLERFFALMFSSGEIERPRYRQIARFATGSNLLPSPEDAAAGLRILQRTDLRRYLSRVRQPCLVVHGEADNLIPCAAGERLADGLLAARFERFDGCGHAPFLTRPETFSGLLKEFCS